MPFEYGEIVASSTTSTVQLCNTYVDPVVVCTPSYRFNARPIVVRVSNVGTTSFDVRLQNPGDLHAIVPERVWYIVMEVGVYDIDGVKFEAQKYLSTRTDNRTSWVAQWRTYGQTYTTPVVLGQVMTTNDADWSVFWCRGNSRSNPPSATQLYTGKHVAEDTDLTRANETVGFIVFETGHHTLNGVDFDARVSTDVIQGVTNSPPDNAYFLSAFTTVPQTVLVAQNAMDGANGGWPVVYGDPPATTSRAYLSIDEDQIRDSERSHITDQAAMLVFERPMETYVDSSSVLGFDVTTTTSATYSSGLHWGDLNDDGYLDAIVTGSSARLMLNGNGTSFFAGSFNGSVRRQGALLDLDNDGDLDFWAGNDNSYNTETAFLNDGSAGFSDAGNLGFGNPVNNEGVAAADVDRDGWIDVVMFSANGNWIGHHQADDPPTLVGTTDVSYGLNDPGDFGNGDFCSSVDVNNDGAVDFFYNIGTGRLFLSNGDGTYTESASGSGINIVTGGSDKMGTAWGDYDNDGDVDLFVPRYDVGVRGYLWRNNGGTFSDVTIAAGIDDMSGQRSACWGDVDNDGDLDLYVVTHGGADNVLYENNGDGTFGVSCAGAEATGDGHDAVFVDFDNDGDLDLSVTQQSATNVLLENVAGDQNYLLVRMVGAGAYRTPRSANGTRVEVWDSAGTTFIARRDVGVARGFGGAEPMWLHFGGLDPTQTYTVRAYFESETITETVEPQLVSTTIGPTTIPQMLTILEPEPPRMIRWVEVQPVP